MTSQYEPERCAENVYTQLECLYSCSQIKQLIMCSETVVVVVVADVVYAEVCY